MSAPERDVILRALLDALSPNALAIWEGGSAANGRADDLSDIDLVVLVANDAVEQAFEATHEALSGLGPLDPPYRLPEPTWHGHSQCFHHVSGTPPTLLVDLVVMRESAEERFLDPERHGFGVVHLDRGDHTRPPPFDATKLHDRMLAARTQIASRVHMFGAFVDKELARGRTIDAMSFYHSLTLRPLITALGMVHRPLRFDFGRYVHEDFPADVVARLERLHYVPDPADLSARQAEARAWLLEVLAADLLSVEDLEELSRAVRCGAETHWFHSRTRARAYTRGGAGRMYGPARSCLSSDDERSVMVGFLLEWLILSVAFWGTAELVPGVRLDGWKASVFVSALYATLHLLVGWLLFAVFAIGTLGVAYLLAFITWWIIGALVLLMTDALTRRFEVAGFGTALIASAVLALLGSVGHWAVAALA